MLLYQIALSLLLLQSTNAQIGIPGITLQTCALTQFVNGAGGFPTCAGTCFPDFFLGSLGVNNNQIQIGQGTCPANSKCVCNSNTNPLNPGFAGQCGIKGNGGINGGGQLPILPRVIGGSDTVGNEWCWQAAVMSGNNYIAGGALIHNQWVVTSAFRVYINRNTPNILQVQLGGQPLNNNNNFIFGGNFPGNSVVKNVIQIIIHEQYNPSSPFYENNIALLKLDSPIDTSQGVCTICLPDNNLNFNLFNRQCTVTGYGSTMYPGSPNSQTLKAVTVPIIDDNQCNLALKTFAQNKNINFHPSFICAGGEENRDGCTGDGGSPLACEDNGRYVLRGIVSWGLGCGQRQVPGVYTRISYVQNWINSKINNNIFFPGK